MLSDTPSPSELAERRRELALLVRLARRHLAAESGVPLTAPQSLPDASASPTGEPIALAASGNPAPAAETPPGISSAVAAR